MVIRIKPGSAAGKTIAFPSVLPFQLEQIKEEWKQWVLEIS